MNSIAYKTNTDETLERLTALYNRETPDRVFACFDVPGPAIARFREKHPEGFCGYPDPEER
ncbi:MAG: hypothetical protein ACYC9O_20690, partial [Candidatus Latescibacterota bacterium]